MKQLARAGIEALERLVLAEGLGLDGEGARVSPGHGGQSGLLAGAGKGQGGSCPWGGSFFRPGRAEGEHDLKWAGALAKTGAVGGPAWGLHSLLKNHGAATQPH